MNKRRVIEAVTEFAVKYYPREEIEQAGRKLAGIKLASAAKKVFSESYKAALKEDLPGSTAAPTPRKLLRSRARVSAAVQAFRKAYAREL